MILKEKTFVIDGMKCYGGFMDEECFHKVKNNSDIPTGLQLFIMDESEEVKKIVYYTGNEWKDITF